ncbi:AtpZ/AtpI family protein [Aquabacterium sp.]|uniref:AtpZ/AtpI family protein n=1 Tax=Aquabacterium sp. TaxID=1872578 RepID=UPI0035B3D729
MSKEDDELREALPKQVNRLREARRAGFLGLLVTGGTAGLLLTIPLVAGAYLGRWLDEQNTGYSVHWTVNLILLGLALGIYNVYLFFKEHGR